MSIDSDPVFLKVDNDERQNGGLILQPNTRAAGNP